MRPVPDTEGANCVHYTLWQESCHYLCSPACTICVIFANTNTSATSQIEAGVRFMYVNRELDTYTGS